MVSGRCNHHATGSVQPRFGRDPGCCGSTPASLLAQQRGNLQPMGASGETSGILLTAAPRWRTLRRYRATTLFLLNATQIVDYGQYSAANDRLRIAREVENGCGTIPKPLLFLQLAPAFLLVA